MRRRGLAGLSARAICWIAGGLLIAAVLATVSGSALGEPTMAAESTHPVVASGQPCSSCKAKGHDLVHAPPYQGECTLCHNLSSWTRVEYVHRNVDMNLNFHAVIGCGFCHTKETPEPKPACAGCHKPVYHAPLPDCEKCHSPLAWRLPRVPPDGHVSLTNGHAILTCLSCHSGSTAFTSPKSCAACHGPKHGGLRDCGLCHDPSLGWKAKPSFDHSRFFVLTGKHKSVPCDDCHPVNAFASAKPQCVSCHGTKHGGLRACYQCHTTRGFSSPTFRHSRVFVLEGAHAHLRCSRCHPNGAFARVIGGRSCASCHGSKHGGLTQCASCHNTTSFARPTFRHSSVWRLTGRHAKLACKKCHPGNRFAHAIGSPARCTNCHGVKHGGQTDCGKCHTTSGFAPAKDIAHPGLSLSGAHASRACSLCHPNLNFSAPTKPCKSCHTAPHTGPTDCLRCHRPTSWSDVHFSHSDVGYHTSLPIQDACIYCHTTGDYTEHRCDACHLPY
jgi:hypothetical protein